MQNFKRAALSSAVFIITVLLLGIGLIEYNIHSDLYSYYDCKVRNNYSGRIDTVFCGSSQFQKAIIPTVINKKTGLFSYNLSGSALSIRDRYFLLMQELPRNPVDTLIIDVTFESFPNVFSEGTMRLFPRISGFNNRLNFFIKTFDIREFENIYGQLLLDGEVALKKNILGYNIGSSPVSDDLGHIPAEAINCKLSGDDIISKKDSESIDPGVNKKNIKYLEKIVNYCNDHNITLKVVVVPISENKIWTFDKWCDFYNNLTFCSDKYDLEFYDFNLLKNRWDLFDDATCYNDGFHMSEHGATVFSEYYAEFIQKLDAGEDVSDLFYSSYEEMKEDSPYMEYYKAHCGE